VLERGEAKDWFATPYITVLAIVAGASIIAFIWRQLTYAHPIVDLSVLTRSSTLSIAGILTFVLGFGLFSSVFIVPVFAQRLLGYNAMQTGLLMLPGALTSAICLPLVGRLMQKVNMAPQPMVIFGFILTALYSFLLADSTLDTSSSDFLWPLILRGVGLAFISVPLTNLALYGLRGRDLAQAAALNNMMRQFGGSFGIAFVNTFLAHRLASNRAGLLTHVSIYDPATRERLSGTVAALVAKGAPAATAQQQALAMIDGTVTRQAMLLSYTDAFILVAIFFVACVPLIMIVRRKKKESEIAGPEPAADADELETLAAH
jgi:DHA2 family multidrug resistance protein